jgi:hypothetical protein
LDEQRTLEEMFSEFLKIYKFINHGQIMEALNSELNDIPKKKIYELSDGVRSTRDIQKMAGTGASPATITGYWKQWALKGIVVPAKRKGRYKAAFDLNEYGLSVIDNAEQGDDE